MYDIKHIQFHFKYVKTIGIIDDELANTLFFSLRSSFDFLLLGFRTQVEKGLFHIAVNHVSRFGPPPGLPYF